MPTINSPEPVGPGSSTPWVYSSVIITAHEQCPKKNDLNIPCSNLLFLSLVLCFYYFYLFVCISHENEDFLLVYSSIVTSTILRHNKCSINIGKGFPWIISSYWLPRLIGAKIMLNANIFLHAQFASILRKISNLLYILLSLNSQAVFVFSWTLNTKQLFSRVYRKHTDFNNSILHA